MPGAQFANMRRNSADFLWKKGFGVGYRDYVSQWTWRAFGSRRADAGDQSHPAQQGALPP